MAKTATKSKAKAKPSSMPAANKSAFYMEIGYHPAKEKEDTCEIFNYVADVEFLLKELVGIFPRSIENKGRTVAWWFKVGKTCFELLIEEIGSKLYVVEGDYKQLILLQGMKIEPPKEETEESQFELLSEQEQDSEQLKQYIGLFFSLENELQTAANNLKKRRNAE